MIFVREHRYIIFLYLIHHSNWRIIISPKAPFHITKLTLWDTCFCQWKCRHHGTISVSMALMPHLHVCPFMGLFVSVSVSVFVFVCVFCFLCHPNKIFMSICVCYARHTKYITKATLTSWIYSHFGTGTYANYHPVMLFHFYPIWDPL